MNGFLFFLEFLNENGEEDKEICLSSYKGVVDQRNLLNQNHLAVRDEGEGTKVVVTKWFSGRGSKKQFELTNGTSGSEINSVGGRVSSLSFTDDHRAFSDHRSSFSDCSCARRAEKYFRYRSFESLLNHWLTEISSSAQKSIHVSPRDIQLYVWNQNRIKFEE